uniref:IKBKB interacting protein n=1 Tax=Periophthalmus magnuspinnatus TaxID=409849 RepID=A0A3B3ZHC4_9GOBI
MPNEVKQRKKTQPQKPSDDTPETVANGPGEGQKVKTAAVHVSEGEKRSSTLDFKGILCLLSLAACNVRLKLESLGAQKGLESGLKRLEQDVIQLKDWAFGLSEKQSQLQSSLTTLKSAVGQIEDRTSVIAKDFTSKVASVRTDVRRMDGLRSELESLLSQVGVLEDKTMQVEHSMVKRIGDVLANSIDRVSNLRSSSERNGQAIEQLQRRIPELVSADRNLAEQLRELESGRARVIRTVTFASNLKPKVFTIKRDFGALEPQLTDLTLRIGQLAEDLTKREQEILELRQTLVNLTTVESELGHVTKHVSEIVDDSDIEVDRLT